METIRLLLRQGGADREIQIGEAFFDESHVSGSIANRVDDVVSVEGDLDCFLEFIWLGIILEAAVDESTVFGRHEEAEWHFAFFETTLFDRQPFVVPS